MESFFKSAYGSDNVKVAIGANGMPVLVASNRPVDTAVNEKRDDRTAQVENEGKTNEEGDLSKVVEENEDEKLSKLGEYDDADKSAIVLDGESDYKTLTTELSLLKKRFEEERDDESLMVSLQESMKKDFDERIRNIEAQFESMMLEQAVKPKGQHRRRLSFLRPTRSGKSNNSPTPSVELKSSSSSYESASET